MSGNSERPRFEDGKDAQALRTIGEVTKALGVRQHVLRYWEEQFPALQPIKRAGGRRYYRPEDIALIAEIDRLVHHEGYTLRGARQAIEGRSDEGESAGPVVVEAVIPAHDVVSNDEIMDRLRAIRAHLAQALVAA
ncbi:DNA-binding transcriptional MerR regulator [Novosphingobium sp. PhB165]|uniref:MerR family transcriptional regulator n=1 Tax=Novosphingobium sp. PhB165 TaxID=2485105 RepID=UPI0010473D52|nr:MerR family transcriptional regulator [Novosphingobium sp. PhB165]TCM21927.1 DNA-binding transcriptional MerR regulator [Novosphingobium sp. PhB165]